ncbi:ATP synthase F1 subunit epsilon [Prevotella sp. HUN102]|uniref:ATP synthase F1 subunit epsilon n=1 Tax=Prevotella sp. HUN102 TaxID=1392486 RepID=UPI00048E6892|nr:ATP synthase F1 subunit epsilon [Prevotella sp. HUN102]
MLSLKIISPEKIVFAGEVDSVLVPGEVGEFEILNNHAPIISTLVAGRVVYAIGSEKTTLQVLGGFVEVKKNEVNLCVEM